MRNFIDLNQTKENTMGESVNKLSENYRKLRLKFLELHDKCNKAEEVWEHAAEAAGMALDAMSAAEKELLAASAGVSVEELNKCLCPHHDENTEDPDEEFDDD